jgi:hypothetical protein
MKRREENRWIFYVVRKDRTTQVFGDNPMYPIKCKRPNLTKRWVELQRRLDRENDIESVGYMLWSVYVEKGYRC